MADKRLQRRRQALYHEDPYCHWCDVKVVYFSIKRHQTIPNNFATIDHLDPKLSPLRGLRPDRVRTVLSCYKCNNERDKKFTALIPLGIKQEMAQRHQKAER